jgi:hypothetical protein
MKKEQLFTDLNDEQAEKVVGGVGRVGGGLGGGAGAGTNGWGAGGTPSAGHGLIGSGNFAPPPPASSDAGPNVDWVIRPVKI